MNAVESKEDIGIENIKSEKYINFDNKFLENFKKTSFNNSPIILKNLRQIMQNIKKDLNLIINTMNNEYTSYIWLNNSERESINNIIKSTKDIDFMVDNVLNKISNFEFYLRSKENKFNYFKVNYMKDLEILYTEIIDIFEYSLKNQKMISSYLYRKECGIDENLDDSNEEKLLLFCIDNMIIEDIKEFKYLNQESCSEIINKIAIMLLTNDIVELLINLKSERNVLDINQLISNIIDFQAKILEYKYPIENKIDFPLKIIKYNNITKEIENRILDSLDSFIINYIKRNPRLVVNNYLEDIKKREIILQYKEFFENINRNIETNNSTLENSTLENNNMERIALKDYIHKKREIFSNNFLRAILRKDLES